MRLTPMRLTITAAVVMRALTAVLVFWGPPALLAGAVIFLLLAMWLPPPPAGEGRLGDDERDTHQREIIEDVPGIDYAASDALEVVIERDRLQVGRDGGRHHRQHLARQVERE